ncbi:hypothetical protein GCM10023116_35170 [Kistimonas scapharcae]|uniref:KfrA N-terminal DNA-binding domain-containing protein n=1 Tax=Kistimonas scapharcae TaxID=1036133 RepID=A0ABP8V5H9_9GAMM
MSQDRNSLRRTKVFGALDAMKETGEKITAQKLAAVVNMGKQTVLPLYREWQELEILGDSEGVELSEELVRALKRELARDKHRQSTQLLDLEERIEDQHQAFTAAMNELEKEKKGLMDKIKSLEAQNQSLSSEKLLLQKENAEQLSQLKDIATQLNLSVRQLETAESRLVASENGKERALQEQEKRLDEANQKLLNHWLSVVDNERRENERLRKQLEREREKQVKVERELIDTRLDVNRLDSSLEKAKDESTELLQRMKQFEQQVTVAEAISLMLDKPNDLMASIKNLQDDAKSLESYVTKNQELKQSLQAVDKKLEAFEKLQKTNESLEKEVIRLQAYTDGLEAASKTKSSTKKQNT